MANTLNKQAAQFIKVGATGCFEWLVYGNEGQGEKETRATRGTFEIIETHSQDFVISITQEDGTKKTRVFCDYPAQKKDAKDSDGNTVTNSLTWTFDGFTQMTEDKRVHGCSYRFARTMKFNPS